MSVTPAAPAATPAAAAPAAPAAPAAAAPATPAAPAAEPPKTPAAAPAADAPKGTILGGDAPKPKEGEAPKAVQGAPEKYEAFKMPEGVELSAPVVEQVSKLARDLNLSQESAQKAVDFYAHSVKEAQDAVLADHSRQVEEWRSESKAHFGAEWEKSFGIASKAIERFGSPELRTLLNDSGLGNHPQIVKFFYEAGRRISEDQPVDGRRAGGEEKSTAALMFPSMNKK